jgi:Rad52/22 family double-strand break repair protein
MSYLSDKQIELLLKPIHSQRVLQLKGLSYVEGHDIRAELNRIFGFAGWSFEILDTTLICETEVKTNAGKPAWYVVYRSRARLILFTPPPWDGYREILATYDGTHAGESTHPVRGEAHGNAVTNSETYALKRCAMNLGDQFGLSLYNKGSLEPIVRWTLVGAEKADTDDVPQVSAEAPEFAAEEGKPEPSHRKPPARPAISEPLTAAVVVKKIEEAKTVDDLRETWKEAGAAGLLQTVVGENGTVQDRLYDRHEALEPGKSARPGTGSPGKDPGEGEGGK